MPLPYDPTSSSDDDIGAALNVARNRDPMADAIQNKISGLNQSLTGLDLEANTPQFNTGIGGAGMPAAAPRQLNDVGLYSHAAEYASTLQPRGDAKQMISTLKNIPGVKPEELQNAGLIDEQGNVHPEWADRGKITNTDLANHLQSSMPQVQETILGFNPSEVAAARAKAESQGNNWDELGPVNQGRYIRSVSGRRLTDYQDDPKYAQYTLPGGENYREVLLTTPVVGEKGDALNKIAQNMFGKNYTDLMGDNSDIAKMRLAVKREYQNQYGESGLSAEQSSMFRSNHWDDPNVLAHLRMSDRTGPNGEKILHVEELQSDWGQKGRDNGFKSNDVNINDLQNQYRELDQKRKETYDQLINEGSASVTSVYDHPDFKQITDKLSGLDQQIKKANNAVPSAPYVTNTGSWTDLALKRALKEAAEGGYDKLVWTPGSEQAQRYDLSKQISRLVLENNPAGGHKLRAYSPSGDQVINQRIVDADKELPDLVGKEVAQKLLNQDLVNPKVFNENLTKDDISVVPKENRYQISAPWGWSTHVGMGVVNSPEAAAEYGANHFSNLAKEANSQMGTGHATEYKNATRTLVGQDLSVGGEGMKSYYNSIVPKQLQKITKQYDPSAKVGYTDVMLPPSGKAGTNNPPIAAPGIDITPQMRESIMRGQKAFKRGGRTLGNNAIDNALRLATGGVADDDTPTAPISLQDLKDWKQAHPLSLSKNAMDNIFTSRQSGFEGAEPIAMPANLDELMAYLRRQHHATGGRAHFGFGGDTDSDSHPESGQTGTASAERSAEAQAQQDNSAAARQEAERTSPDNASGESAGQQIGQMGRGAGEGNGLAAAIGDSSGGMFGFGSGLNVAHAREALLNEQQSPTDIQDYTSQRLNTPYQGSLLSATMDPSNAFGMGYGSLVGKQNTRAGAAGFLGSAMGESGAALDPSAINAGSIGMLQETGPRRVGLENTLGIDTSLTGNALRDALAGTQMAQLGYGLNEVQTNPGYSATRNAMATGTNAANVADVALQNFERPTLENQILSAPSREAYAQGIMAGNPSGATLGVGQYDAAPASFRDALMGGVKQADQQKSRLNGDNTGAMLANASVSDASNDPAITAARNAAIASGEMPQSNPYAGFSSEDPAEIARYNAAMNAAGPKNAYADTTLGQRVPDVTSNNPFVNMVQGASNAVTNMITPSYGINSPEYNKISQAVDIAREPSQVRGGEQPYVPPTAAAQAPAAPVAPYTTELGTYNQQLPSVGGMTAAQWAAANTAGDMSKVHGRIKYVNGAPMLEYYTQ